MRLTVQPDAGILPIIAAIKSAKKTIDVLIFRLDREEITRAFEAAVGRGAVVRALIAHTNRGGAKSLRKLELRLLESGVSVSRSADDLVRYHAKMLIVDGRVLHLYGFNFTRLDVDKSRSFGIATRNAGLVREAVKLFEADVTRQPYVAGCDRFVVSPENARERLSAFIKGARKELLIYDPKVNDPAMVRLLAERQKAGVEVKIIGKVSGKKTELTSERCPTRRLHVRAIIRDGRRAFMGSQSLRKLELERRREIGVIIHDESVVRQMQKVFEQDWELTDRGKKEAKKAEKAEKKDAKEDQPAA